MTERPWEIERDRFGLMFSGPLEVGEEIEVVPAERAERAEAAAKDFAKALLMLEDWHGDERTYLLINEAFSRHPGFEIPALSEAERDGGQG